VLTLTFVTNSVLEEKMREEIEALVLSSYELDHYSLLSDCLPIYVPGLHFTGRMRDVEYDIVEQAT